MQSHRSFAVSAHNSGSTFPHLPCTVHTFSYVIEFFSIIIAFYEGNLILCRKFTDESLLFFNSFSVLFLSRYIRIIVEYSYMEIIRKILYAMAAARCAAAVKKQCRNNSVLLEARYLLIKLFLKISLFKNVFPYYLTCPVISSNAA